MFCFARLSVNFQSNGYVSQDTAETHELPSRDGEFMEIQVTWNSKKLNRALWKTKKFHDSHVVQTRSDTALGKAFGYANKLLQGGWLTKNEYTCMWQDLLNIESHRMWRLYSLQNHPFAARHRTGAATGAYVELVRLSEGDFMRTAEAMKIANTWTHDPL